MEIFLIKRDNSNFTILEDYFFKHTSNKEIDRNILFFKFKKLIEEKHLDNFFFNLPFSILSKILKTIESPNGDYLVHNLFVSAKLW